MNTAVTSREAIISVSKQMALEKGLPSINMRTIAERSGIAVGSIYNYFPSKADLVAATVEDIWTSLFQMASQEKETLDFIGYVEWFYNTLKKGLKDYAAFFAMHSMGFASNEKEKGRIVMEEYFSDMKQGFFQALLADNHLRRDVFDEAFTQEEFVDFVFSNIISSLIKEEMSCTIILEIIRRLIY